MSATTTVRERPILFSGPMVRAILDGRKTQTRRIVNPQPTRDDIRADWYYPTVVDRLGEEGPGERTFGAFSIDGEWGTRCPYGSPGDTLLWVRETWQQFAPRPAPADEMPANACIHYRADFSDADLRLRTDEDGDPLPQLRWRPSIFMPRWASRLTLRVTNVRVERLHEITEQDAKAEGVAQGDIEPDEHGPWRVGFVLGDEDGKCGLWPTARRAFEVGWDSINGKRAPWASNPWVWVVGFERMEQPR